MSVEAAKTPHHQTLARWRYGTFGPASEQPYRRRITDVLRLVVLVPLMTLAVVHHNDVTTVEQSVTNAINHLPDWFNSLFTALYQLGTLWAVATIILAALVARRWRLARDLVVAGAAAWVLGRLIGVIAVQDESVAKSLHIITRFGDASPSFPLVRLAVIVAVVSTSAPYLTRPMRRLGQLFMILMTVAALYLGLGTFDAAAAGLLLGWGIATLVHLAFGSPGGRPTRAHVAAALAELDVDVVELDLAPEQTIGATLMVGRDVEGPLRIRVLGRDEVDAQLMAKFWRSLLYKDGGATVHLSRLEDVEHEAYTVLLAASERARVSHVVVAGTAGPGTALIAERPLVGPRLADLDPSDVTDPVLDDVWQQVVCLHAAHVAHGRLNARHVVLTADGAAITDFEHARAVAPPPRRAVDVAELLCSTAGLVGPDRAVAAARRTVGEDPVVAALPLLQVAALSRELYTHHHRARKAFKDDVDKLRAAAAAAAGVEEPPLQELYRVNPTQLLMAVGTLIVVFALLSEVGNPSDLWHVIQTANWWWLTLAIVLSFSTNLATAIALQGCVPGRLPLLRTSELQLSMSFSNLAVPAVGGLAAQVRFLQKQGIDLASAVAAGGLLAQFADIAVSVVLFGVALVLSPTSVKTGSIPLGKVASVVLLAVLVLALVAGLVAWLPVLRNKVLPPLKSALATIWEATRSPRRLALLVSGNLVYVLLSGFVLLTCIAAFGGHIDYWTLLAMNIGIGTIASLVPIPGGGTAVGSVGMTAALAAAGVATPIAVAAVLAQQLVFNFIPAVPGWFATNDLLRAGYL